MLAAAVLSGAMNAGMAGGKKNGAALLLGVCGLASPLLTQTHTVGVPKHTHPELLSLEDNDGTILWM